MGGFVRRFSSDPGLGILLDIESVNILDLAPPSAIGGIGTGAVTIVGEFEDGPFAAPYEADGETDLVRTFGTVGYNYAGVPANNPCAIARKADGALVAEFWNGNGAVQLSGKQFARLFVSRVDTSVGSVQLNRNAFLAGNASFRYALANGQVLSLDVGAGFTSATFTATAATVTAVGGTYPTTFTGVETLTLGYDAQPNFTVQFLSTDQTIGAVVARINAYAGFAFADTTGGQVRLTGLQKGNGAQVRVVGASAAGVLTQLGLTVANTAGTGNVADVSAVTVGEIKAVVEAAVANTKVTQTSSGALRVSNTTAQTSANTSYITVGAATTALGLGLLPGASATSVGQAVLVSTAQTFPNGFVGGETLVLAVDGVQQTVTFLGGDTTQANVLTRINAAFAAPVAVAVDATHFAIYGQVPGGSVVVVSATGGAAPLTKLGLAVGTTTGVLPPQGILPAGTVVQQPNGQVFVLMQTLTFASGIASLPGQNGAVAQLGAGGTPNYQGPWTVKIRHAKDDGSGTSAGAGTVTQITNPPDLGSFGCTNLGVVSAALSENAIDAQYTAAIQITEDINQVTKQTNVIYSARQSNSVRQVLHQDALTASSNGCFGRVAVIRPPLGTTKQVAMSTTAAPGVGAYRDQVARCVYTWPQMNTTVPAIQARGLLGGPGFTASGAVDVGADGFIASAMSQLPPEEDPAQDADLFGMANGLESSPNATGLGLQDYVNLKAAGICAPRVDDGVVGFQSGVTTVDSVVYSAITDINRRRMADYIQDSIAQKSKGSSKKLMTQRRRLAYANTVKGFLEQLLSRKDPDQQRIGGYTLDRLKGNTQATLAAGAYRLKISVQTLSSFKSIILETTIGPTVTVQEILPQAA